MSKGPIVVLWNPSAGGADAASELRQRLQGRAECLVRETGSREQLVGAARQAADAHAAMVVAAGGDGTVNGAVNGLAMSRQEVPLAILPLGTGNDFCRTLDIPLDPLEAFELLWSGQVRRVDRVRVESGGSMVLYVNMGSGGFSAEVVQEAEADDKRRWGPLAYLRSAAGKLTDLTRYEVQVRLDDEHLPALGVYSVVLANGRTTSGGVTLAPEADPADGLLEVMLVTGSGLGSLAKLAGHWLAGRHLESDQLIYRRASRVQVNSRPPMTFSLDGEPALQTPVVFTVEKKSLRVVVASGSS